MAIIEKWKPVVGHERFYEVSNLGRVRSFPRNGTSKYGHVLNPGNIYNNYQQVILAEYGKHYHMLVHRLVAEAFIPNPNNRAQVNHIDGDATNNCVDNLEWVTVQENMMHGKHGYKHHLVLCVETGKEYAGVTAAAKLTGTNRSGISNCFCGRAKSAGGYHWKLVEKGASL